MLGFHNALEVNNVYVTAEQLATTVLALVLFGISLYGWSRRRHPALLTVSIAFFLFFLKILIDELEPPIGWVSEFIGTSLEFAILLLFFLAIVVGARRKVENKLEELA